MDQLNSLLLTKNDDDESESFGDGEDVLDLNGGLNGDAVHARQEHDQRNGWKWMLDYNLIHYDTTLKYKYKAST